MGHLHLRGTILQILKIGSREAHLGNRWAGKPGMAFQWQAQLQGSKPEHMWGRADRNPPGVSRHLECPCWDTHQVGRRTRTCAKATLAGTSGYFTKSPVPTQRFLWCPLSPAQPEGQFFPQPVALSLVSRTEAHIHPAETRMLRKKQKTVPWRCGRKILQAEEQQVQTWAWWRDSMEAEAAGASGQGRGCSPRLWDVGRGWRFLQRGGHDTIFNLKRNFVVWKMNSGEETL